MRILRTVPGLVTLGLLLVALLALQVWAAWGDRVEPGVLSSGGSTASGGSFLISGTVGQPVADVSAGGGGGSPSLELESGYWHSAPGPTGVAVEDPATAPKTHRLLGAYPNPFNPRTQVQFELASVAHVRVHIFDVRGQRVRNLVDETRAAGPHAVLWDATDDRGNRVASGTYYLRLTADDRVETRKVALLK